MENIVLSKLDKDFKYEIAARPGAGFFKRCFSCGTCTASCPVSEIDERFNPRLFIRQALMGQREELLSSELLWYCTQCYTCFARCPQDVRFIPVRGEDHLLWLDALQHSVKERVPSIFNTDQGLHFISGEFTARLQSAGVGISIDGHGRVSGSIFIERLWPSARDEESHLND